MPTATVKPLIELRLDHLTEKRATLFDQAVVDLFAEYYAKERDLGSPKVLETSRAQQPKSIKVTEEELRFIVQNLHENRLNQEYGKQEDLLC